MNNTESLFQQVGGVFCTPVQELTQRLRGIKAFVFDWDGVFNNATKNENKSSTFNEADSMGTNMLRFGHYLKYGSLPYTAIISGELNSMALYFSEREHFDASYYKVSDKLTALNHFCEAHKISPAEVCFVFDDILDLGMAEVCGVRILVNRRANPLFKSYVVKHNLADYITGMESGNFAVREACEMILGLSENYDSCLDERKAFSETYQQYLSIRQNTATHRFTWLNGSVVAGATDL